VEVELPEEEVKRALLGDMLATEPWNICSIYGAGVSYRTLKYIQYIWWGRWLQYSTPCMRQELVRT